VRTNMSLGRSSSTGVLAGVKRRPRPLKIGTGSGANRMSAIELSSVEDVIVLMENTIGQLSNRNYEYSVLTSLIRLCENLKQCGAQLDNLYQDQLDKLGVAIRNACRDDELDLQSRVHLLQIIELRAMNWVPNESTSSYFRQKFSQIEQESGASPLIELRSAHTAPTSLNANAPDFSPLSTGNALTPGEIIASSGRFIVPTKIPGKNYFKDEIVIRNADSGKVMGLKGRRVHMIEEMTETIISFQRVVPGAKERLVQITGPGIDNILQAKKLIEDTIRRNQSPGREEGIESPHDTLTPDDSRRNTLTADQRDSNSVSIAEYKYTVNVADSHIKITGSSLDLVRTAKLVLDEYFSLAATTATPLTADTQFEDMILPSQSTAVQSDQYRKPTNDYTKPSNEYSKPSAEYSKPSSDYTKPSAEYSKPSPLIQESNYSTLARPKKGASIIGEGVAVAPPVTVQQLGETPPGAVQPAAGVTSPAGSTSIATSAVPMPLVYTRADLLRFSASPLAHHRPIQLDLLAVGDQIVPVIRSREREGLPFDGARHLKRGRDVFAVDYARSYPLDVDE